MFLAGSDFLLRFFGLLSLLSASLFLDFLGSDELFLLFFGVLASFVVSPSTVSFSSVLFRFPLTVDFVALSVGAFSPSVDAVAGVG